MCVKCGEESASGICRSCHSRYSPTIEYHPIGDGDYFIGAEIEVEAPNPDTLSVALQKVNRHPMFFTKSDGSLGAYGLEIVSRPLSLSSWYERFAEVDDLFFRLKHMGCKSWDTTTCGLHFHVGREAIGGNFHYWKLLKLFSDEEFVLKITGRDPEKLRRWARITPLSEAECWGSTSWDRYTLLNRTENTLEFRGFKGTLSVYGFYGALELYVGAIEFTREASKEDVTIENFKTFINARRLRYADKKLCV